MLAGYDRERERERERDRLGVKRIPF